jgi:hypothetical protein
MQPRAVLPFAAKFIEHADDQLKTAHVIRDKFFSRNPFIDLQSMTVVV